MKKVRVENNINKYYIIIGGICIVSLIVLLLLSINKNTKQQLVQSGLLEHTEIATGYIVKNEKTIQKDQTKVLVPVVSEGTRITKDGIIATYKSDEYKNYEETLAKLDKEILERMKYLPVVYSSEVDAIDETIYYLVKQSMGETSYNKMQEYKQKINTYINKRANIIGELSPDGAEIKELIRKRNEYEEEAKKSNDNIISPIAGIVSYTTDGLEDKLGYENVDDLDYNTIKNLVNDYQQVDNLKIKVVDNYEAYIVMKVSLDNAQYIDTGYNYRLRLIDEDNYEFLGKLERVSKTENGIEVYFKVTNGIENIIGLREAEIEIVWDYSEGLIIPSIALKKYDNKEAYYVTAIKNGRYENIPVNIRIRNENYVLVNNYTEEELKVLNIDSSYNLKLYDRVIIESNWEEKLWKKE